MFKRPKAFWISSSLEEGVAFPGGKDDLVDGTDLLTSLVEAACLPEVSAVITSLDDLLDVRKDGLLGLLLPVRVGVGGNDEIPLIGEGLDNLGVLTAALHVLHVDGSESRDNLRLDVAVVLVLDHLDDLLDLIVGSIIRVSIRQLEDKPSSACHVTGDLERLATAHRINPVNAVCSRRIGGQNGRA